MEQQAITRADDVGPAVVTGSNVGKTFANGTVVALDNAEFTIPKGRFVSLVGPSGCGKSTLLRLIAGLIAPTSGQLHVHGTEVSGARQDVAMMFQRATLLEWRTAIENVLLPTEVAGGVDQTARDRAMELLHLVGQKDCLGDVVRNKDRRRLDLSDDAQKLNIQALAGKFVQRAEGFIQQDDVRAGLQQTGKSHTLLHPARKLRGERKGEVA